MELKRQIEFDKYTLSELETAIDETTIRFNGAMDLIKELNERLISLNVDRKDYKMRIALREQQLRYAEK